MKYVSMNKCPVPELASSSLTCGFAVLWARPYALAS